MSDRVKAPEECLDMSDVRLGVDTVDQQIMDLLERRFGYMRAAARIKPDRASVRDEARKSAVIAAVRSRAEAAALPAAEISVIWDRLVEASIAYELLEWNRQRG